MSITGRGAHKRSRRRLALRVKDKGQIDLKKALQTFNLGDKVIIDPSPYFQKNIPHRRFFGINGTVLQKKGKAYTIEVMQGKMCKMVDMLPIHLKKL
ncbi:MAG: 50S ribosomal protein L21e [Candidatus Parvarchaeota archaeon]|nr:50S ribosomal protein L21e [Candidatus Parvarchaeota archaeon]MCL5101348.1 50S ribosomal protein L21e [Candidatus Parvarchaeota archaeon]